MVGLWRNPVKWFRLFVHFPTKRRLPYSSMRKRMINGFMVTVARVWRRPTATQCGGEINEIPHFLKISLSSCRIHEKVKLITKSKSGVFKFKVQTFKFQSPIKATCLYKYTGAPNLSRTWPAYKVYRLWCIKSIWFVFSFISFDFVSSLLRCWDLGRRLETHIKLDFRSR